MACFFSFLLDYDEGTRPSGFVYKPVLVFLLAELSVFSLVLLALSGGLTKGLREAGCPPGQRMLLPGTGSV